MLHGTGVYPDASQASDEDRPIFVVANRGPQDRVRPQDVQAEAQLSSGGLATTFISIARRTPFFWLSVDPIADTSATPYSRAYRLVQLDAGAIRTRAVPVTSRAYQLYYERISNGLLWPLHHEHPSAGLLPISYASNEQAWREGYLKVNRAVAAAVVRDILGLEPMRRRHAIIMLQDYHLYCAAGMIRHALPAVALSHFVHVPWPDVSSWRLLPRALGERMLTSLLHADVVGLQTPRDVCHFLECVRDRFPDARQELTGPDARIMWRERQVLVRAYPIAVDPPYIQALAEDAAREHANWLRSGVFDHQVVLRVDRAEPSKNILRGVQAFELLLERHPHLQGRVCFLMLLLPERNGSVCHTAYTQHIEHLITRLNARYSVDQRPAVIALYGHDRVRALAAMRAFDVLLANSIAEGMHLVTKESVIANRRHGVVVVSRTAGVYQALRDGACLGIAPDAIDETADALYAALSMPLARRRAMAAEARRRVEAWTVTDWWNQQVRDIASVVYGDRAGRLDASKEDGLSG